jgi:uncharacterized protein (TIGR03032 family)
VRLPTEFVRLPLRFDAERLAEEVLAFAESDWKPHPQGYPGNSALSLIAVGGDPGDDSTAGPMRPTPHLGRCPYIIQTLAALGCVVGRTRLMRLDGNAEATAHADSNYYWVERARVHVPIVTTPNVLFHCGERAVHMAAGDAWVFDTWRIHNVVNPEPTRRIHLVADTVGSVAFWELVASGEWPFGDPPRPGGPPRLVPYRERVATELSTEERNQSVVMSPWEWEALSRRLLADLPASERFALEADLATFLEDWRARWARYGAAAEGHPEYRELLSGLERRLERHRGRMRLGNGLDAAEIARQWLVLPALNPGLGADRGVPRAAAPAIVPARPRPAAPQRFDRPVFIVSPPRSGSSLLFETLAQSPDAWTIGGESHALIESIRPLHPRARAFASNRLEAVDARPAVVERLTDGFFLALRDRDGRRPVAGAEGLRLVEKTPKNALRVPFLAAAFPDARFVYLYRNPRETINSIYEAWGSGKFVTYPRLPGWNGPPWSLALAPGWREWNGKPLAEIAALQWRAITETLLEDLAALGSERWCVANYGGLVSRPEEEVRRLAGFLGLSWDRALTAPLPPARHVLTPPAPGKWRRNRAALEPVLPLVAATAARALDFFARRPGHAPLPLDAADGEAGSAAAAAAEPAPAPAAAPPSAPPASPLRSVHTASFARLLEAVGGSLLVSTYQSGRLVLIRAAGGAVNTHFSAYPSPMGVAIGPRYLAVGTRHHVWEFRNVLAAARRLDAAGKHDACFLPRRQHFTGDLRVHELAFAGEELWIANTRFSCLSSLDEDHSFVPRWRPPFVSALAAEDRCHLNGLAVSGGRVAYVTALGATDAPQGWREGKAAGGVLLDVESGEPVAAGLSMPHSPRAYDDRLWVLESGKGELNLVDRPTGRVETVVQLPGFTRGLAFAGPYAFVGLSQVRESVFGGIPLGERIKERVCGIWVVDIRSGAVAGFLRFEDAVQEIFDVQFLRGIRAPYLSDPAGELVESTYVLPPAALREAAESASAALPASGT